jgi:hypothetical protein
MSKYYKVKPGDDPNNGPVFDSEVWATLLQMIADYKLANQRNTIKPSARKPAVPFPTDVVMVQNTTSDNIERYRAMFVDSAVVEPSDNSVEFQKRVVFTGLEPTGDSAGRWGVLIDSLTPGQIGRIAMIGVVTAWVNIVATTDTAVEAVAGSYVPNSGSAGSAELLYVAGGVGTASATGPQWTIIKIGGGSASIPAGQYEGMIFGDVTTDQTGFFFPSATPMTGSGS